MWVSSSNTAGYPVRVAEDSAGGIAELPERGRADSVIQVGDCCSRTWQDSVECLREPDDNMPIPAESGRPPAESERLPVESERLSVESVRVPVQP